MAKPINLTLFYTGTIQPLKTVVVTVPTEGVIDRHGISLWRSSQRKSITVYDCFGQISN